MSDLSLAQVQELKTLAEDCRANPTNRDTHYDYQRTTTPCARFSSAVTTDVISALLAEVERARASQPSRCGTCRYFRSTAEKDRYPNANAGECHHNVMLGDDEEPFRCWETFGCTLHKPLAPPQGTAPHEEERKV